MPVPARRAALALALLFPAAIPAQRPNGQPAARPTAEQLAQQEAEARYVRPPAPIADFFARDASFAVLDAPAPGGRFFLVPRATQLSTLALMSRPTLRLAELEIRPATDRLWHLDTFGVRALQLYDLQERRFRDVRLPANTFVSDWTWSPDGARVAFLAHRPERTEVWVADAATGRAERVADVRVLATLGTEAHVDIVPGVEQRPSRMLQWTPEGTLLTLAVPAGRGAAPTEDRVPVGPSVRLSRPAATPTRTFPNLLRDAHDAALFEHHTRAQLVELAPGRAPRALGEPRMYESVALSADGRHVLARWVERPFSFLTSWRGFPSRTGVLDRAGAVVVALERRGLREGSSDGPGGGGAGGGAAAGGLRGLAWHPAGAGLTYLKRVGGNDQVMLMAAPFDTAKATVLAASADPIAEARLDREGRRVFATVTRDGRRALAYWDRTGADTAPARRIVVGFHHPDSLYTLPGELWVERTPNGVAFALTAASGDPYLRGEGLARDFRPRPFVDRVSLADTTRARLFQGAADTWDRPLVALDPELRRMVVSREGRATFPDSHLWERGGALTNLTRNANPFPELAAARRRDFTFTRQDGLEVQASIALPLNYREGEKVPAIFWTYPREFTTADGYRRAAARARNHNAFPHLTWLRWSELWLTQGYALVYPDVPIIGQNYNDTYVSSMVDAMYGAMRAVERLAVVDMDRVGHGGHSYGAFATANLLAHTPFFRAGIAGDGAYNRSLTPTGFQAEPRSIWSASETYLEMSPYFKADQIRAPILLYHGGDDNNTGTWPLQSERFMHALTSLGKTAALYVYPYESHTPRAVENTTDLWARWVDWFDRYVKGNAAGAAAASAAAGGR
jgi:dipeptidyl aminopeptidase/acylaminoacyl peptidase